MFEILDSGHSKHYIITLVLHGVCGLQTMCPQYISLAKMGCHFGSRIRTLILQDQRLSKSFKGFCGCNPLTCFDCAAMADSLFDFELLESADVLVDFDADEALNAVAAAETAQLETDQDEMAILADYVVPPNKTPEDLARDLEAMVSGVNTLSLQATEGTAVVVAPLAVATTSTTTPLASSSAPAVATAAPPSGMVSSTPPSSPPATSLVPALAPAADVLPGGTTASSVDIPKGPEEPSDVDMVQSLAPSKPAEPSAETSEAPVPMDTTPPGLEAVSTTTSSRKRPLDRGDNAGALAGASGPDTGIPVAESPGDGALVGSAVSGASAGASCPDTEPPKEAPPSSVRTSGSLADCGKLHRRL